MTKKCFMVLLIFFLLFGFGVLEATSGSGPPSDQIIRNTIEKTIEESWGNGSGGGIARETRNFNLESLEILAKGKWHKEKQWILIKTRVKFTSETRGFAGSWRPENMDETVEFKVFKDDYGHWRAVHSHYTKFNQLN